MEGSGAQISRGRIGRGKNQVVALGFNCMPTWERVVLVSSKLNFAFFCFVLGGVLRVGASSRVLLPAPSPSPRPSFQDQLRWRRSQTLSLPAGRSNSNPQPPPPVTPPQFPLGPPLTATPCDSADWWPRNEAQHAARRHRRAGLGRPVSALVASVGGGPSRRLARVPF